MEAMFLTDIQLLENIIDGISGPEPLKLSFLEYMTDNFSENRVAGRGGFGVVYKGEFKNRSVAVKKLTFTNNAEKEFDREIINLLRVNHKNIVRLLGYCNNRIGKYLNVANPGEPERLSSVYTEERIICFEYISNGSLSDHIHDELRGLEWHTRYKIIKGICQALDYLHNKKNLVHRDLKPENILIDNLMAPKIADLGISKLLNDGASKSMTTNASASWAYAAPEFADRVVSVKYDIHSLGIIIIEIVTGFRQDPDLKTVLTRWRHRWNKSDDALTYQQVGKCIEIGLSCQNQRPKKRPFISQILKDLDDVDGGSVVIRQEIPSWNELLWVEPLELFFPFQINKQMSCSLELHNNVDAYMAFFIKTDSDMHYNMDPKKGVIQPQSRLSVSITLLAQDEAPVKMWNADEFTVKYKKVNEGFTAEKITKDFFSKKTGGTVDKVRIGAVFDAQIRAPCMVEEEPKEHLSLDPLEISSSQDSGKASFEAESSTQSVCDLDKKVIDFPSMQDKKEYTSSGIEPGSVQLAIKYGETVPWLGKLKQTVMVEVIGGDYTSARPGLDLVAVLDVSSRLWEEGLQEVKTAMRFVLHKLGPIDRLSIVTLSSDEDEATELCPLRQITEASRLEVEEVIEGLKDSGDSTAYVKHGLLTGLKVLADRKVRSGRVAAMMLVARGEAERSLEAAEAEVSFSKVPVYTFGVGARGCPNYRVLKEVAAHSKGGTFSYVEDRHRYSGGLTMALSQCLAGLLTVAVSELQVRVAAVKDESTLLRVCARMRDYSVESTSATIWFGDVYSREVRRVIVDLGLPANCAVDHDSAEILSVKYTYISSAGGLRFTGGRQIGKSHIVDDEVAEFVMKEDRLRTPRMDMYLDQAKRYYEDPAMLLPSTDDDVKEELGHLTIDVATREKELRRLRFDIDSVRAT